MSDSTDSISASSKSDDFGGNFLTFSWMLTVSVLCRKIPILLIGKMLPNPTLAHCFQSIILLIYLYLLLLYRPYSYAIVLHYECITTMLAVIFTMMLTVRQLAFSYAYTEEGKHWLDDLGALDQMVNVFAMLIVGGGVGLLTIKVGSIFGLALMAAVEKGKASMFDDSDSDEGIVPSRDRASTGSSSESDPMCESGGTDLVSRASDLSVLSGKSDRSDRGGKKEKKKLGATTLSDLTSFSMMMPGANDSILRRALEHKVAELVTKGALTIAEAAQGVEFCTRILSNPARLLRVLQVEPRSPNYSRPVSVSPTNGASDSRGGIVMAARTLLAPYALSQGGPYSSSKTSSAAQHGNAASSSAGSNQTTRAEERRKTRERADEYCDLDEVARERAAGRKRTTDAAAASARLVTAVDEVHDPLLVDSSNCLDDGASDGLDDLDRITSELDAIDAGEDHPHSPAELPQESVEEDMLKSDPVSQDSLEREFEDLLKTDPSDQSV